MRYLVLLFLLSSMTLFGQEWSGNWDGDLVFDDGRTCYLQLQTEQVENKIAGKLQLHGESQTNYRLDGEWEGNMATIQLILDDGQISGDYCDAQLLLQQENKTLKAQIMGDPYLGIDCPTGQLTLNELSAESASSSNHKQLKRRTIKEGNTVSVNEAHISLLVYDHLLLDGDIASIYFNGKRVLKKYRLDKKAIELDLELLPNQENSLVVFSHDTGEIYPTTVAVELVSTGEQFILNSDKETCDVLHFNFRKPSE